MLFLKNIEKTIEDAADNSKAEEVDLIFVMSPYMEQLMKKRFEEYKIRFFYSYNTASDYLVKHYENTKIMIIDKELNPLDLSFNEQSKCLEGLIKNAKEKKIALVLLNPYQIPMAKNKIANKASEKEEIFDQNKFYDELVKNKETTINFFNFLDSIEKIKEYLKNSSF